MWDGSDRSLYYEREKFCIRKELTKIMCGYVEDYNYNNRVDNIHFYNENCVSLYDVGLILKSKSHEEKQRYSIANKVAALIPCQNIAFQVEISQEEVAFHSTRYYFYHYVDEEFYILYDACNDIYELKNVSSNKDDFENFIGDKDELFKNVFVKIENCPEWIKSDLYNLKRRKINKKKKNDFVKKLSYAFRRS